ncbi:hypothetical protein KC339_g108 [Hortaea werneckii]|nr:hypothetical protein KC339_g108 [Hortaea werneckii]
MFKAPTLVGRRPGQSTTTTPTKSTVCILSSEVTCCRRCGQQRITKVPSLALLSFISSCCMTSHSGDPCIHHTIIPGERFSHGRRRCSTRAKQSTRKCRAEGGVLLLRLQVFRLRTSPMASTTNNADQRHRRQ